MFARVALFLLMAIGLAGFGAVAWINLHPPSQPASTEIAQPNDKLSLLVAARPLRAGALLKADDVAAEQRPAKDVPVGARMDTEAGRSELIGALIRRNLVKGEVILSADALNPGDRGFLAAVLGSGMRAVTVGVDAVSGLAGLVWPGDRVDLILTQSQEGADVPPSHRVSGETVLHDVRVLAIDRQLVQGATSESPESQAARTVTLEVTPADAARVAVATRLGHLSLAVVAVASAAAAPAAAAGPDTATASPQPDAGITWGGDVSSALRRGGSTTDGTTVRLFQGPSESKEIHF
jgi:pilus assembly protein CpaB